jgi:hypothetical protein
MRMRRLCLMAKADAEVDPPQRQCVVDGRVQAGCRSADAGMAGRYVHARDRDQHLAGSQHRAVRPLHVERPLLHAVRGRRLPAHHLLSRSPGRSGALPRAIEAEKASYPYLLSNGNPTTSGDLGWRPSLRRMDRSASQALLPVRARRRRFDVLEDISRRPPASR